MGKSTARASKANSSRGSKLGDKFFRKDGKMYQLDNGTTTALTDGYMLLYNVGPKDVSRKNVETMGGYSADMLLAMNKLEDNDLRTTISQPIKIEGQKGKSIFAYDGNGEFGRHARIDNKLHNRIKKTFGKNIDYVINRDQITSESGYQKAIKIVKGNNVVGLVMPMRHDNSSMPSGIRISARDVENLPF